MCVQLCIVILEYFFMLDLKVIVIMESIKKYGRVVVCRMSIRLLRALCSKLIRMVRTAIAISDVIEGKKSKMEVSLLRHQIRHNWSSNLVDILPQNYHHVEDLQSLKFKGQGHAINKSLLLYMALRLIAQCGRTTKFKFSRKDTK